MKIALKTILGAVALYSLSIASPALAQSGAKKYLPTENETMKDFEERVRNMTQGEIKAGYEALDRIVKRSENAELRKKGADAYERKEFSNARSIFYKGAMNGDRGAQYLLAMMDEYGDDGTPNYKSALRWYKEAAYATRGTDEIDEPGAHFALGNLYFSGKGTAQDYRSAYWSYERAARGKHPEGSLNLGMMHYMGWGTKKNNESAIFWFKKADALGAQGAKQALKMVGIESATSSAMIEGAVNAMFATRQLVIDGKIAYYEKDYQRALELFQKPADKGHAEAQLYMGMFYNFGHAKPKSFTQAIQWFQKSAAQDNAGAQFLLGNAYFDGNGVTKSHEKAIYWYRKSADQGHSRSMYNLGARYYYGQGVTQSDAEAINWFKKSAAEGYQGAKDVLKKMGVE